MGPWTDLRGVAHRLPRSLPPAGLLTPALLAAMLLGLIVIASIGLGLAGIGAGPGRVALGLIVSAALVLAFVLLPKPTLLVFALLVLLRDTLDRYLGYSISYVDDMTVPLLFVITLVRARPWATGRLSPVREGAVLAVIGLAALSSLANGVPLAIWLPGMVLLAKVILFLYVAAWHDYEPADLRQFAATVGALALVAVGLGFVETVAPQAVADLLSRPRPGVPRGDLPSARSIFFHPVLYGWFAGFVGLYLFAAYAVYRRWWMLVAGLLCSVGVALSARRRALLALLAGVGAAVLNELRRPIDRSRLARVWVPIGGLVLALTLVAWGLGGLVQMTEESYLPSTPEPPSGEEAPAPATPPDAVRLVLYRGSVEVATEHFPLGAGLGRYGSWMSRVEYSPLYDRLGFDRIWGLSREYPNFITDTFWPQILGEIGLFGLVAYLVFVAAVGFDLLRAARRFRAEPLLYVFTVGALMVFANGLVETLASSMFHSPPRIYLLFGAVGISLALLRMHGRQDATRLPDGESRQRPDGASAAG